MKKVKQQKVKFLTGVTVAAVCIMALLFSGKKEKPDSEVLKIGIAVYNLEDSYMEEMTTELEKKLEESFGKKDAKLRYEILDAGGSEEKQSRQMDYLLNQNIDILVLNPVDPASVSNVLDQAHKKEIAVILFNREPNMEDMNVGDRIWYVGSDGQLAGRLQGEMLIGAWNQEPGNIDRNQNGKIDYLMVEGEPAHYDTIRRTSAFIERTADEIPMNLLADFSADWNRERAYEEMHLLSGDVVSGIEAVICNNDDMALGIYDFYKERADEIPLIIGINDNEEVHELVDSGILYGTVGLNQEKQVDDIIRIIENLYRGGAVEQKIWYSVPEIYSR